ncbi:MAG: DegT/DnrJ/EryC1/StrS family aminotransferase, partial [bacterium]
ILAGMPKSLIRLGEIRITPAQRRNVQTVLRRGWVTEGPFTRELESVWARFVGTRHAVACSNGTVGLMLALQCLSVDRRRPVLVPALTFPATVNAALLTGYPVRLVDVGEDFLMRPADAEVRGAQGIMPVHLFGYACDMDHIGRLARRHKAWVLEDACEAAGTMADGGRVGSFGDAAVFSFYASHNLQAGELGVVTTNSSRLAHLMRSVKNHGRVPPSIEFKHARVGYNFKTTEFAGAFAVPEIAAARETMRRRADHVRTLNRMIRNPNLRTPRYDPRVSYLGYPLIALNGKRDRFCAALARANVQFRKMFPCLTRQGAYRKYPWAQQRFPIAEKLDRLGFYVPCHQYLVSADLNRIADALNRA